MNFFLIYILIRIITSETFYTVYSPNNDYPRSLIINNNDVIVLGGMNNGSFHKFNNNGQMIFNCMDWCRDLGMERIHETQKPIALLQRLIELFTDPDDVVIDPCAGSGSTLIAAANLGRKAYGMEISKRFYVDACDAIQKNIRPDMFAMQESKYYQRKVQQTYIF